MIADGFIRDSFNAMIGALECAAERAGLITRHAPVTHAAARRFMSSLRQLETLLRRLLVLMAAELELDFQPITPAKAGVSSNQTAPSEPVVLILSAVEGRAPARTSPSSASCAPAPPRTRPVSAPCRAVRHAPSMKHCWCTATAPS